MNYFYLFTVIVLYLLILFIKKDNKKHNFVINSIFLTGILYSFNIFLIYILSILNINNNFIILSLLNILFIGLIICFSYRKNKNIKLQKFEFNYKEILSVIVIITICVVIGMVRFDKFSTISYETTDPAAHFRTSSAFASNLQLLTEENSIDEMYGDFARTMPGFSLNCGIFMRVFTFLPKYVAYEVFDVLFLCLLALTFYATCLKIKKVKNNNILVLVITCLYFLAYCLNNFVFGFGYLGAGILAVNLILFTYLLINEYGNNFILDSLLFLFNFLLFFSYYLFIPTIYLAEGLYLLYNWYKKKYEFKKVLKIGLYTLIFPFILGILYFHIISFVSSSGTGSATSSIAMEGYIYRDLWSNFILIMPLVIYSFINDIKNKHISILSFMYVIEFVYILVTFILGLKGYVSSYYYFKSYYIFWLLNYIYIIKLINTSKEAKLIFDIGIIYIAGIIVICLSNIESRILNKNILFNNAIVSPSYANIYWFNGSKIVNGAPVVNNDEIKILNKVDDFKDRCLVNNEIPLVGNYMQKLWFYSLTDIVPIYNHQKNSTSSFYDDVFNYNIWSSDDNARCLIIFNSYYNEIEDNRDYDIDINSYSVLYQNNGGVIIEKR